MAQQRTVQSDKTSDEGLARVFFRGFFWPVKMLGKGIAFLSHQPPFKQIGHGLRWFFTLKPLRFIGRILGFGYFYSSSQELKQVTWPTWRESRRLTTAVIIFSLVFGVLIALVDFGLDKLFKQLFIN